MAKVDSKKAMKKSLKTVSARLAKRQDVFVVVYQDGTYVSEHWEKTKKKKKKQVSRRLAKRHVFAGQTAKTSFRLAKGDFDKNKRGKTVSNKVSARASKSPIKKGTPLYAKAKALFYKK